MARPNLWKRLKELECLTCSCSGRGGAEDMQLAAGAGVTELAEIAKRAATEHAMARTNVDIKLLAGRRGRDREGWAGRSAEIAAAASGDRHAMARPGQVPGLGLAIIKP